MKKAIPIGIVLSLLTVSAIIASAASDSSVFHKSESMPMSALNINESSLVPAQPQVKTFNTTLSTIKVIHNGEGTIGDLPDPVKLQQEIKGTSQKQLPEAGPLGAVHISDTLNPYAEDVWGPIYLLNGEWVTVSLSWYPPSSQIYVGLQNVNTGVIVWGPGVTGGSNTWSFQAWADGNYNVIILNHSGNTVTYDGYISW